MSIWTQLPPEADTAAAQAAVDAAQAQLAAAQAALEQAEQEGPAKDDNSDAIVDRLAKLAMGQIDEKLVAWIDTDIPVYEVPFDQATIRVTQIDTWGSSAALNKALTRVPVPSAAKAGHTSDLPVVVRQPSTGMYWEFWGFRWVDASSATCRWAGVASDTSLGYFSPAAYPGAAWNWGISASKLMIDQGLVTAPELYAALNEGLEIPHAITLVLKTVRRGIWAWPAQWSDGDDNALNSIPYGARFRLPANYDVEQITNPVAKVLARAVQRYGLIVRERTHVRTAFDFRRHMDGDPDWGPMVGNDATRITRHFPWPDLYLEPMDLRSIPGHPPAQLIS